MEGWVGPVGWPIANITHRSGHMSTINHASIRESPPAKDWATPPTAMGQPFPKMVELNLIILHHDKIQPRQKYTVN